MEIMCIMYTAVEETNIGDLRSYEHYWSGIWNKAWRFIWIQHNDQLPVGMLAQLVERCTGITEFMSLNPVRAWFFFRPYFNY